MISDTALIIPWKTALLRHLQALAEAYDAFAERAEFLERKGLADLSNSLRLEAEAILRALIRLRGNPKWFFSEEEDDLERAMDLASGP